MSKPAQRPGFWLAENADDVGQNVFIPGHYSVHEQKNLLRIMALNPLAQLFTAVEREHHITACPMIVLPQLDAEGKLQLVGHMAGRNPQVKFIDDGQQATAVFSNDGAYVSPQWFKVVHTAPTWNYQSVQIRGTLERIPNGEPTMEVLRHTIELVEGSAHSDPNTPRWTLDRLPSERAQVLNGMITAFRLHVDSIEGVERLGQDKHLEDILSIMAGLSQSPQPGAKTIMGAMAEKLATAIPVNLDVS